MSAGERGPKQSPPADRPLQTYLRLLTYLRPYRGAWGLGLLGGVIFAASQVSFAWFAKQFGDGAFTDRDPQTIVFLPLLLVVVFFFRGLGDFTQTYFMGSVARSIVKQLRRELFDRLLRLPVAYYDRNSSPILLTRITHNTEQIGQATTDSVIVVIRELLTIMGAVGYLFYLNPKLAAIALTMGPLVAWLVSMINKKFRRYSRRIQDSVGDVNRVAKEMLEAPRVIKVYNAQEYEAQQFELVNEHNRRSYMRWILTKGLSNPVVQLVTAVGSAFVLSIAIADAIALRMTAGDLLAFLTALVAIAQPLRALVGVAGPMQQGIAAGQSIFELLDETPEVSSGTLRVDRARGAVEFNNVNFSYQTGRSAALHDISLRVEPGETVAIVGKSGSGKSTLVNLLPRFYEVTTGAVLIDGRDVRDYELTNLREQIALVSQDIVLFNDTIRNNIAFGRPATLQDIERVAEAAHVLEFVRDLPEGMETTVGERGVLLSGGQRQRISIARALLKDAPILILDEATSALDTESERIIQAALEQLMRNRTTLVIAHRLSTVEKADRIIVMEQGQIIEAGTHAELIARGGQYATLHRLQFNV